jgi:hypothetical protein
MQEGCDAQEGFDGLTNEIRAGAARPEALAPIDACHLAL